VEGLPAVNTTKEMILSGSELDFLIQRYNETARTFHGDLNILEDLLSVWETLDKGWMMSVEGIVQKTFGQLPAELVTPTGLTNNRIKAVFATQGKEGRIHWSPIGVSPEEDQAGCVMTDKLWVQRD
jgi:hypothetical protein